MKRKIQKPVHEVFNDGFLIYGRTKTKRDSSGKRIGEKFNAEGKLAYKLMSARAEDHDMAGSIGASLDKKVKTRFPPGFRKVKMTSLKARMDTFEYDVINVDWDSGKRYLYFYLQEVGEISE
ncbi:phage head-tail adapter protein [Virgibacillus oceani]|uniref:Head-tail adaptor protein n=1 Tax=Virgibacillus oceani TaxID=1479511 RepID=A0A917LXS4_9BACI|nr:phage head-tail adapter protein [Virgibacillus oceani]GGG64750.1 head-tail adaptor protein [Virgibacillus oceani]